jgi:hypothetical protein
LIGHIGGTETHFICLASAAMPNPKVAPSHQSLL